MNENENLKSDVPWLMESGKINEDAFCRMFVEKHPLICINGVFYDCYEDINWDDKTITINKTVIFVGGKPTIQDHTKTDAGNRTVPLLPPLENVLPKKKKGIIFEFEGGYYTRSKFDKSWNRFRKEHGVKLCAHQLRHAYATILYEAGVQFKDAQLLMGHNSSEVTQEIYTHISEKQQKKTFTNLINYVSGENAQ